MNEIEEYNFNYIAEFIAQFPLILFPPDGIFVRETYVFRGHGSGNYKLKSSFDRHFDYLTPYERVSKYEKLVKYAVEELEQSGSISQSESEYVGLAQHYGVPTRLLDWTSSPLIAAYFAFHDRVMRPTTDRFVTIWALRREDDVWNKRNGVEVLRLRSRDNERAFRQLGYATVISTPDDSIEEVVGRINPRKAVLWKFNIDASDAQAAFAFLDACNVRATELFGSIEGACRSAFERLHLD